MSLEEAFFGAKSPKQETVVVESETHKRTVRDLFSNGRDCATCFVLRFKPSGRDPEKLARRYRRWRDSVID